MSDNSNDGLNRPILIKNAGLAVIAHYLEYYFSNLGMLNGGAFSSPEMADRAVHLVQYLATGKTGGTEDSLALNKLLCGLSPEASVSASIELTEQEVQASDALLKRVIKRWIMMDHLSIEQLQYGFLIRGGSVKLDEEEWLLTVDESIEDAFLEYAIWGKTFFRFTWMGKPVKVEWESFY